MNKSEDQDEIDRLRDRLQRELASVERQARKALARLELVESTSPIDSEQWTVALHEAGKVIKSAEKVARRTGTLMAQTIYEGPKAESSEQRPVDGSGKTADEMRNESAGRSARRWD